MTGSVARMWSLICEIVEISTIGHSCGIFISVQSSHPLSGPPTEARVDQIILRFAFFSFASCYHLCISMVYISGIMA